jgi:APA family basic amino acid/polyamine antiporter
VRFVVWLAIGLIIYFTYSRRHSRVRTGEKAELPSEGTV